MQQHLKVLRVDARTAFYKVERYPIGDFFGPVDLGLHLSIRHDSLNFGTGAVLKENQWTRVAVVMKQGEGISVYADGQLVGKKESALGRQDNAEPLILGREAWGGDPPTTAGPGFFIGLLDEVRIWTRALSAEEVAALP